jgi:glucosamine-6-phosphate deaminase
MLQRDLLGALEKPPRIYHRLDVNASDPADECGRFDALVGDGGLDLTLLGLGGNGHLGLNEPGTEADSPTRVADLAPTTANAVRGYDADADPVDGMTLGLQRILASDEIWLLVTGRHKAAILERTINGPISSDLPASFLRDHPNAVVYADRSAAALL